MNRPNFSARYKRIAPDSNTATRVAFGYIYDGGDFRVRVDFNEATRKLITLHDVDAVRIVISAVDAFIAQLFEQDRHFDAIWRVHGVELNRLRSLRKLTLELCAGGCTVDAGEFPAARCRWRPDGWRHIN